MRTGSVDILISAGCLVYHGPREQVVPFFESLGFRLPPRKGTADFLQEITSRKDQQVRSPLHKRRTAAVLPTLRLSLSLLLCECPQHDLSGL